MPEPAATALPVIAAADCKGCGACCKHMRRPPFYRIGDPAWARLRAERPELAAAIDADLAARPGIDRATGIESEWPCLWLDPATNTCRHHEFRPEICEDFEPGRWACHAHRHRRGLGPDPGPGPADEEG